ncbi:XkdN-like protein [Bacillus sp. RG28]|uniref:XkdN-like protein n=1 Tax=Gottfriedia endophytica TaxID=2820819 RepID=A0A940NNR3_9BACI|nr:XkdN-like protein [Gottfriedia endophytica]MBP0725534.1 XkdN-like protein [Gottfriedia endophytica]
MSVVDLLLKMDKNKLELQTKEIEIKRLSQAAGEPIIFKVQAIPQPIMDEIQDMAMKINPTTKELDLDLTELKLATVLNGVIEPNFKDENLIKHYGAATPYDLIKKLFNSGERDAIYNEISVLNGYGENVVEEVKKQ